MALPKISPDLFDRIINVEFLGESFEVQQKKLDTPREVTKQEYEALSTKYTQPASGNITVISPKIIGRKGKDGPYTISTEVEKVDIKRQLCYLECGPGIKPQISLSFKMLPGQLVYHVILKVTNLELPFDIRDCSMMKIKAGYRDDSLTQSFSMGVFTSYVESPGPDDVTVFEGVIVDSLDSFFTTRKVQINLNDTSTIGGLLEALEMYLPGPRTFSTDSLASKTGTVSSGIQIHKEVEPEVLKLPVSLGNHSGEFDSGYQALNWAIELIQDAVKNQKTSDGNPVQIFATVFNTDVVVMDTAHKTAESKFTTTVNVPVINNIKRASFTGPLLTLIAAWYPPLTPGRIFEMEPNFFNGHALNNSFDPSVWKTDTNTYRVITMEVNFDTTGKQNEMTITALPTDENGITEEIAANVKVDTLDDAVKRVVNQPADDKPIKVLDAGRGNTIVDETVYPAGSVPDGDSFDIPAMGVQIKMVASKSWPFYGPKVNIGNNIEITVPYNKKIYDTLHGVQDVTFDNNGLMYIPGTNLWPLIYIATYRAMKAKKPGYHVPTTVGGNMSFEASIGTCEYGDSFKLLIPKLKSGEYKDVLAPYKDMLNDVKRMLNEFLNGRDNATSQGWYPDFMITTTLLENL